MEDHEPTPRYSGLRPPTGPPTNTAIGFSPESDGDYAFNFMKHLVEKGPEGIDREVAGPLLAKALALHNEHSYHPDYLRIQREYYLKLRQGVEDQRLLEQLVQRPQRAGRLPGSNESGLIETHERTLVVIDDMLIALNRAIEAANAE